MNRELRWAYGITTVPERLTTNLPITIKSLKQGGFAEPILFVDGADDITLYQKFNLLTILRPKRLGTVGNWILSMWELYIQNPVAHRYALFQDDLVCCKNLKRYLDKLEYPAFSYLNLYNFPQNEARRPDDNYFGFYPSNQRGRGAVGLVFSRSVLMKLFTSQNFVSKPAAVRHPKKNLDGCIIDSLKASGITEYVHYPSLVQHTGKKSTIGNREHELSKSFPGTSFDISIGLKSGDKNDSKNNH